MKSKRRRFYRIPGKPVKSAPFRHSNAQQSVDPLLGAYIGIDTECRFFYGMRNELLSSFFSLPENLGGRVGFVYLFR